MEGRAASLSRLLHPLVGRAEHLIRMNYESLNAATSAGNAPVISIVSKSFVPDVSFHHGRIYSAPVNQIKNPILQIASLSLHL